MLYDPKWEKKIKTEVDPFSLHTLIAWLETQNPATTYSYLDIDGCPLARYFRAHGFHGAFCGATKFNYFNWWCFWWPLRKGRIPHEFNEAVICGPKTYGGVLERARAALAAV